MATSALKTRLAKLEAIKNVDVETPIIIIAIGETETHWITRHGEIEKQPHRKQVIIRSNADRD